jgi:riboflavin kinase/FMN adenylyltransferase
MDSRAVVTIGTFDGVHRGHAALLAEARRLAAGRVVAMVFSPHPLSVLDPSQMPATLTSIDRRAALLQRLGADEVIRLEPTRELLGLSPEAFIDRVMERLHPSAFVEGANFRFGKGRAGDVRLLDALGRAKGFRVVVVEQVHAELTDQTLVPASSTMTRWLVSHGRVRDAARVLGRWYEMEGTVVRGDRRGREIGFPTANLRSECLLLADGVYAGAAHLPDGRLLPAAVHVGERATFDDARRTVEAYVLDWAGPLSDGWPGAAEYGWPLRIEFRAWLRDQARFEGVASLVAQIHRDVARTRRWLAGAPAEPCGVVA